MLTGEEREMGERMVARLRKAWKATSDAAMAEMMRGWSDDGISSGLEETREKLEETMAHHLRLEAEARRRGLVEDEIKETGAQLRYRNGGRWG
jgi:hypothetical protein